MLGGVQEAEFARMCRQVRQEARTGRRVDGVLCGLDVAMIVLEALEHCALSVPSTLRATRREPLSARADRTSDTAPIPIVREFGGSAAATSTMRYSSRNDVLISVDTVSASVEACEPVNMFPTLIQSVLAAVGQLLRIDEDSCMKRRSHPVKDDEK
jgi:hypothetical protein